MNWKFDILDLIIVGVICFFAGFGVRSAFSSPDLPTQGFSSPSSEAPAVLLRKNEVAGADLNAGETNPPHSAKNSLSGHLIKKAADRNGCFGDDFLILLAIRKAENGRDELAWGVMNPKANTFELQAAWAASTIVKTRERFEKAGRPTDFINFLAKRYCPLNNETWERNVRFWFRRFKCES